MNSHNQILETDVLIKTKMPYFVRLLNDSDHDSGQSEILQAAVLSVLPADQTLIHVQDQEGFKRRSNGAYGITLGVFAGLPEDENPLLIAQQTLKLSADDTVPLLDGLNPQKIGCTEGYMVHPNYRGNNLTDILMHHNHEIGTFMGLTGFMSCADASNPYSYNVMLKNGYGITAAYVDAADGGKTYALFRQTSVQMATEHFMPKIEPGHFEEVRSRLQSSTKPVIIYQHTREKVCVHTGRNTALSAHRKYTGVEMAGAI